MNPADYNLQPLPIPVPRALLEALGYRGDKRFFAVNWSPAGENHPVSLGYHDGRHRSNCSEESYLFYVSHPNVTPYLAGYELGTDPDTATHALVFDRIEREAWIGTVEDVYRFMRGQWPSLSEVQERALAFPIIGKIFVSTIMELLLESDEDRERKVQKERLRHPPGPMCPDCHSLEWDTVEASGRGTLYSFVVAHQPAACSAKKANRASVPSGGRPPA